jgi:hypothetical protein
VRTKAHRYSANVPAATFTNGTDVIGVTGDFEGGFVQATTQMSASPGAGQWISAQFRIDGVLQGPATGVWQTGTWLNLVHVVMLRVPPGRHRISVAFGSAVAPIANCAADLSVAELNA